MDIQNAPEQQGNGPQSHPEPMPQISPIGTKPDGPRKNYFMRNPMGTFGFLSIIVGLLLAFGLTAYDAAEYPIISTIWWIGMALLFAGILACGIGLARKPRLFAGLGCTFGILLILFLFLFMWNCTRPSAPHPVLAPDEQVPDTTWEYDDSLRRYIPIVADDLDEPVTDIDLDEDVVDPNLH